MSSQEVCFGVQVTVIRGCAAIQARVVREVWLRYNGSASAWGFAIYRASHDDYEKSVLPTGYPFGTPQETLDCACGLYLGDPTARLTPPPRRINGRDR
jgi:hypothetical protein